MSLIVGLVGSGAAHGGACSAANIDVARNSASVLYVDTGISPTLQGHYAGYAITNSGAAIADAWVVVDGFAGGSVGLAPAEDGLVHIGPLGAGDTEYAYVYLTGSTAATGQTHSVGVWSGKPGTGGAEVCSDLFSLTVEETIQASANKVSTVLAGPNPAILGGIMTMTVTGQTGQVGSGPSGHPDGPGVFAGTPATDPAWPADAYQLVDVRFTFETSGTYNDTLVVTGLDGTSQDYTAVYTFVATGATTAPTSVSPVNYIASGKQIKHTTTGNFTALDPILPTENRLSLTKAAATTSLPEAGGVVRYTVTISSTAPIDTALDDIEDTLPAGAVFQSGSARYNAAPIADPHLSGMTMSFVGVFPVAAGGSSTLVYDVALPAVQGTYTNSAVGHVGSTQIDTTIDTTDSSPASVDVAVGSPNAAPGAVDDASSTLEDTAIVIDVADNDGDPDGNLDPSTVTVQSGPSNGTASSNGDGTVTYTPAADWSGTDSFTYEICDTEALCDTASVSVTVSPVNDPPTAVDDSVSATEESATSWDLAFDDTDVDGNLDPSTLTVVTGPSNGTVVNNGDGTVTYTSAADYSGPDSLTYEICDASGACDIATVGITVVNANDAPTANGDTAATGEDSPVVIDVADNDSDPDGNLDLGSVTITSGPSDGTITSVTGGEVTYVPDPNFTGTDTFTYQICDDDGACDTATVGLTVAAVNDPPVAAPDSVSATEDVSTDWNLVGNDSDVDGNLDPSTLTILIPPANGSVLNNGDGTVTYTSDLDYVGADSMTYEVCDTSGECAVGTVSITVDPAADAPAAEDDATSTLEDTAVVIDVADNDTDPDGDLDLTSITVVGLGPSNGTALPNGDGTITYTPGASFSGSDTFDYSICDTDGACDTATVDVIVNAVDDPPVAVDDTVGATEDTDATWDLALNDTDPDGDKVPSSLRILTGPSHGTVANNGDGTVTYTPDADYAGPDELTYEICDLTGLCDSATVSITVSGVNDPPTARADVVSTPEDVSTTIDVVANDTDVDGNLDPATVTIVDAPINGTASSNGDGTITYTPGLNFNGSDGFTYRVCDALGECSVGVATVTTTIVAVDDAPEAVDDATSALEETATTWDLADNDSDPDGDLDPTTLTVLTGPSHGTIVNNGDGTVIYTSATDYSGPDSLTYEICDSVGLCDVATVTITVADVNDPPVANPDVISTPEDVAATLDVAANDTDPDGNIDPSSVSVVTAPSNGTANANGDGTITYTPAADYSGPDTFTYEICDLDSECSLTTASVTTTVVAVDDPPVAVDDVVTATEDTDATWNLAGNDGDVDGDLDATTLTILTDPVSGTVVNNGDGTVTYTPSSDFSGTDGLTYEVCDGEGLCDSASVSITVGPVDDPPVANPDAVSMLEDTSTTVDVAFNDIDPDDDLVLSSVTILAAPTRGTAVPNGDGTVTYTPEPNFNGSDGFTYEVCDATALCSTSTVSVTVTPAPDAPFASDDSVSTAEDQRATWDVTANDTDLDSDLVPASVTIQTPPSHGSISVDTGTGEVTYSPHGDYNGGDSFEYQVCDTTGACDNAWVTISVSARNDAPESSDDTLVVAEDVGGSIDVIVNDHDIDSILSTADTTIITGPRHGVASIDPTTGAITYVPEPDYNGDDVIEYQLCDSDGACDTGTVRVTVFPVNDAPVYTGSPIYAIIFTGTPPSLTGEDLESDPLTFTVIEGALPEGLTLASNGEWVGSADVDGIYPITVAVCDIHGACTTAVMSIVVGALPFTGLSILFIAAVGLVVFGLGSLVIRTVPKDDHDAETSVNRGPTTRPT